MRGAGGPGRGESRLAAGKRRLLQGAAVSTLTLSGALMLLNVTWAQVTETLPEVTVTAPRPAPVRRATPAAAPVRPAPSRRVSAPVPSRPALSRRVSAPAPSRPTTPAPAPQIP